MRVGEYQVTIPEGLEQINGHVHMRHMQQYTVRMVNLSSRRCNAYVTIDGISQGSYRINAGAAVPLERSIKDSGRFTFLEAGSAEAAQAGESSVSKAEKGVIQVRFVPEKRQEPVIAYNTDLSFEGYLGARDHKGAGMTGLTGTSNQQFITAESMEEDTNYDVTISLRLVTAPKQNAVRPLHGRLANTVPPSVE